MFRRRILITNNPRLNEKARFCDFVDGSSLDVLLKTRDAVHSGWILLSHPLYGNLRPHQHPYRSVLLEATTGSATIDPLSLQYIENAVSIYSSQSSRILMTEGMPEEIRSDFAFIDAELMKDTLSRYSMFKQEE